MDLLFEKSRKGRCLSLLPECDVPLCQPAENLRRKAPLRLPELSESDLSRHYSALAKRTHGMNDGFYPLGSCTMKYNPKINDEMANLSGFTDTHPLRPTRYSQGCLEALAWAEKLFCEICGMDAMTFQPAAGAHGEFTGVMLIKAYHMSRGDVGRTKIIVPDAAHGTNPASVNMNGFTVVNIPSTPDGRIDMDALRAAVGPDTAGLMLTCPNTIGSFNSNIQEVTSIIHEAGGLCYYDGANLNAIMGIVRPGDMGFDVVHTNLHKTFSTPHGGGGPGAGGVGCKKILEPFLPVPRVVEKDGIYDFSYDYPQSIGKVKSFYGNFGVVVRALTYILTLGAEGLREAAENAVLNANYLMHLLQEKYTVAFVDHCMHEFVLDVDDLKKETGCNAMDIAKGLLDNGIHPPTMYFPLIVHEALMVEPTETESKETLEEAAKVFLDLYDLAHKDPDALKNAPFHTPVRRLDDVRAARQPILKYEFPTE